MTNGDNEILYDEPLDYQPISRTPVKLIDIPQFERLKACEAERDTMKTSLKFYADPDNWKHLFSERGGFRGTLVSQDGGQIARVALGGDE